MTLTLDRPVIDLESINPKLFIYVQNLSLVKKLRTNLNDMRRYLTECRIAAYSKLIENSIGGRRHLIQCTNMYSMSDLISVENSTIIEFLNKLFSTFEQHIRKCELCTGKGYVCEICSNIEVLFPFDDGAIHCKRCTTVFHRACWLRKNARCPKCARLDHRRSQLLQSEEDEVNANQTWFFTNPNVITWMKIKWSIFLIFQDNVWFLIFPQNNHKYIIKCTWIRLQTHVQIIHFDFFWNYYLINLW